MMTYLRAVARFFAAVSCTVILAAMSIAPIGGSAAAQALETGVWNAMMVTPGGEFAEMEFDVSGPSSSPRMAVKWKTGEVEATDIRLSGDILSFDWYPTFYLSCRMERTGTRQFKGGCLDARENLGVGVLSPPGVPVKKEDLDFDKAFELWNISRDEYMEERYPQPKASATEDAPPHAIPQRTVNVDGRKVNVAATGAGDLTVVLESGYGDDHTIWQHVHNALSPRALVVSYDRAGLGSSEPAAGPRTPARMADELHATLKASGEAAPYLLVAHGSGAFTAREFVRRYGHEVLGLVLLDPAHEREDDVWRELDSRSWEQYVQQKQSFLSAISPAAAAEFDGYLDALTQFDDSDDARQAKLPVVVISGEAASGDPSWVGATSDGLQAKVHLQRQLAEAFNGEFHAADGAGYVHLENPSVVVEAISKILGNVDKEQ